MHLLLLWGLGAMLGWAVFRSGGVVAEQFLPIEIAIAIIWAVSAILLRRENQKSDWATLGLLAGFVAWPAVQLIPLPSAMLAVITPARAALLPPLTPVLGEVRSAPISAVPPATFEGLAMLAACALVFLTVRGLAARLELTPWAVTVPILVLAGLSAVLGIVQAQTTGAVARATWVNRNHYASFLEMALPFPVMWGVEVLRRSHQRHESPGRPALQACALFGVAALLLVGILLSLSRMGFLAALAVLLTIGLMKAGRGRIQGAGWLVPAAVLLLAAAAFVYLPSDPLVARFASLASTDEISGDTRAQVWGNTLQLIRAYPIVGCGLGAYESSLLPLKTVALMFTVDFAHNDYLQFLAELGPVGFLLGCGLAVRLFLAAARDAGHHPESERRCVALACMAAFVAILLHSVVDFNLYIPANAMLLAWIAGIAWSFRGEWA